MDPNRYIVSKIGLAREMSGMSIATLARRAGMTPNALSESLRVLPSLGIRVGDAPSKRQRDGCGSRCRQALSRALCAQDRLLASFHGKLDHLLYPIQRMIRSRCAPLGEKIEKSRRAHRGSSV